MGRLTLSNENRMVGTRQTAPHTPIAAGRRGREALLSLAALSRSEHAVSLAQRMPSRPLQYLSQAAAVAASDNSTGQGMLPPSATPLE